MDTRIERDFIGEVSIPSNCYWGINTERARENFCISGKKISKALIHAYGQVKLACIKVNQKLGFIDEKLGKTIQNVCQEVIAGKLDDFIIVDPYQGGAGTSTNLNICEVIANRVLELNDKNKGEYEFCDPIEHINLHQSTNDTYPTALRIAIHYLLIDLEQKILVLQEEMQNKEKEFYDVIKIGRTELMDAVPTTLGKEFGCWAEVLSRDRWRIFKCTERIRVINLGGTAIGSGLGAPREYIFQVNEELRNITGLPLARAENLIDATQNQDALVEVMGIIKTHAINLMKIANDLRLLNMGPDAGIQELELPALQAGSSIMPNKVNPVIPEMLTQVAIQVAAFDQSVSWAIGAGQLELNSFLPLVAMNMIESLEILIAANHLTAQKCIKGIHARVEKCRTKVVNSSAIATVLVSVIGYHKATAVAKLMRERGIDFFEAAHEVAGIDKNECEKLISPEALNALGFNHRKRTI